MLLYLTKWLTQFDPSFNLFGYIFFYIIPFDNAEFFNSNEVS